MTFQEAEQEYARLAQQYQAGQLTQQQFNDAVVALRVQDADGLWWTIRAQDGAWLWWNGAAWQPAVAPSGSAGVPYQTGGPAVAAAAPAPVGATKKGRRWWLTCLVLLLMSVCCLGLVGGGGFLAVQAGSLSAMQLSAQLEGVGDLSIANTAGEAVTVRLIRLDTEEGEMSIDSEAIAPFDISGYGGLTSGRYRLEFSGDSTQAASCTFLIGRGDSYQFVVVPEGIAVVREGQAAQDAAELDMATSSLCRQ